MYINEKSDNFENLDFVFLKNLSCCFIIIAVIILLRMYKRMDKYFFIFLYSFIIYFIRNKPYV